MTTALIIVLAGALAFAAPRLADRVAAGRWPRHAAGLHALSLLGIAVIPVALLMCLAGLALASYEGHSRAHLWAWVALLTGGPPLLWIGFAAARVVVATRRASPSWVLGGLAPASRGPGVHVLPMDRPVAFAAGVGRGRVVVSTGLLRLLDEEELEAVLEHERAHITGGHHRLLLLGGIVHQAFGFLSPVRRAFASLRSELEAAADDEAVRAVGDPNVVASAIAKVGLAGTAMPAPAAAAEAGVSDRIRRLLHHERKRGARRFVAVTLTALLALGIIVSQCAGLHPSSPWVGLASCSIVVAWVAARPFLTIRA